MGQNGLNMNAYVDTSGVGQGTWADANGALVDCTVNQTKNTGTIGNRGSGEQKKIPGQRVRSIDLILDHDPTDALWAALNANYESDDPDDVIGFAAMDGPIPAVGSNSVGLQADFICTDFGQTQPLEEGSQWKAKLEPAFSSSFEAAVTTVEPA